MSADEIATLVTLVTSVTVVSASLRLRLAVRFVLMKTRGNIGVAGRRRLPEAEVRFAGSRERVRAASLATGGTSALVFLGDNPWESPMVVDLLRKSIRVFSSHGNRVLYLLGATDEDLDAAPPVLRTEKTGYLVDERWTLATSLGITEFPGAVVLDGSGAIKKSGHMLLPLESRRS